VRIFIDTSAIIAFMNEDDEFYKDSFSIFSRLLEERAKIISSNYVLLETMVILKNRIGIEAIKILKNDILPVIKTCWIDEDVHSFCVNTQIAADRKKVSLVDYTSFEIMRRLNIRQAFTFDGHYKDMGFEILKV
jgi:predicted nucleic acid-binding protein